MTDRVYIPVAYVDDICPPLRPSPSDWLIRGAASWHLIANRSYRSYCDSDEVDQPSDALADGQIVEFEWREDHPSRTVTVTVLDCGTLGYSPAGFVPASLNMFWVDGDFDTMMDTLDGCLENFHDMEPFTDGQDVEIGMAEWGDASFRLVVNGAVARFEPVNEAPRATPAQLALPGTSA